MEPTRPARSARPAALALALLSLIWGYNWVVMKQVVPLASPLDFSAIRTLLGAASLFVAMLVLRRPLGLPVGLPVVLLGLLQTAAFTLLIQWALVAGGAAVLMALVGAYAPAAFLSHFTVFVLACFVGYMVVWNVKPALHTPLMSVTNAISSIIAIGALVQISPLADATERPNTLIIGLAAVALVLTAINMFGGFAVTQRMLAMFRK